MTHRHLTGRQARFAREYPVDLNATRAAIRAGYSRRSASQRGWELRRHPGVAARIDAALAESELVAGVTPERVLYELALLGFYDIRDYLAPGEDGAAGGDGGAAAAVGAGAGGAIWVDPLALTRDQAAAITEIQIEPGRADGKVKIKLADKSRSLELIGRYLGLFPRAPSRKTAKKDGAAGAAGEGRDAVAAGDGTDAGATAELSDEDRAQEILRLLVVARRGG